MKYYRGEGGRERKGELELIMLVLVIIKIKKTYEKTT